MKSIQLAMQDRLAELAQYTKKLDAYPHDLSLRLHTGYTCLHAARQAAEASYRTIHGVEDIAPGLQGPISFTSSKNSLKELLQQVLNDDITQNPMDPLHRLATVLYGSDDMMAIGVAATQACVALLGLREFGGVFGAWQLGILGFDLFDWKGHIDFNNKILSDAHQLFPEGAEAAAKKYQLPGLEYLIAGAYGNIAKAGYRAIAEDDNVTTQNEAQLLADDALLTIETRASDATKQTLIFPKLEAMRAACADHHGNAELAKQFWIKQSTDRVRWILDELKRTEPSRKLIEIVRVSSERHSST